MHPTESKIRSMLVEDHTKMVESCGGDLGRAPTVSATITSHIFTEKKKPTWYLTTEKNLNTYMWKQAIILQCFVIIDMENEKKYK